VSEGEQRLVVVSMRFPSIDPQALAAQVSPIMEAAVAAGGTLTSITVQPYHDDEDPDSCTP
jgi:hypothetical protein